MKKFIIIVFVLLIFTNGLTQVLSIETNNSKGKTSDIKTISNTYTHYFCYVRVENDKSFRSHPHHVYGCLFINKWIEGNPGKPSRGNLPDPVLGVGLSGCQWDNTVSQHKVTIKNVLGKETIYELVAPRVTIYGFDLVAKGRKSFSWPDSGSHTVETVDFWVEDPFALKVVIEERMPDS